MEKEKNMDGLEGYYTGNTDLSRRMQKGYLFLNEVYEMLAEVYLSVEEER